MNGLVLSEMYSFLIFRTKSFWIDSTDMTTGVHWFHSLVNWYLFKLQWIVFTRTKSTQVFSSTFVLVQIFVAQHKAPFEICTYSCTVPYNISNVFTKLLFPAQINMFGDELNACESCFDLCLVCGQNRKHKRARWHIAFSPCGLMELIPILLPDNENEIFLFYVCCKAPSNDILIGFCA